MKGYVNKGNHSKKPKTMYRTHLEMRRGRGDGESITIVQALDTHEREGKGVA